VTCFGQLVTVVDVSYNGIKGSVPSNLQYLTALTSLNFAGNR
jgi:hypothetical protein